LILWALKYDSIPPGTGILAAGELVSASFFRPLLREAPGTQVIRNMRNGRVIAHDLMTAFDSRSRRVGLLRHRSFPLGAAMLIAPSNAVHTFFMRFPIDIAFIGRDGTVVKVCHGVRPWRMAAAIRAYGVVELPAGTLAATDTAAGDVLAVVPAQQV
jgi:uncharacterized membrane protein (UPF0127 family)